MSSRKKLTISLTVVALVIVAAVVAVVGVLAATQQTVTSSISIRFTASDIDGSVTARYEILDKKATALTGSAITPTNYEVTFKAADDTTTGTIDIAPTDAIEGRNEALYIEYTFNRAAVDYQVDVVFTGNYIADFVAEYWDGDSWEAISEDGAAVTTVLSGIGTTGEATGTSTLLTRISVDDASANKNIEATGTDAFGFSFNCHAN